MATPTKGEQRKIAVTGASGFIGSHCVLALLEAGFAVVAVVRTPINASKTKFLEEEASKLGKEEEEYRDALSFAAGDLFQEGSYDDAFEGVWGVLHTAGVVHNTPAIAKLGDVDDPYGVIVKSAVDGTKNVLSSFQKHSSSSSTMIHSTNRFVTISSVAAVMSYDQPVDHVFNEDDWNTWSTVEKGDAYGYAKTKAERAVWDAFSSSSSMDATSTIVVSLNPSVVLGPVFTKSHAENSSPSLIRSVLTGETMLNVPLSFVDVRDVAKGAVLAFTQDKDVVNGKRFILNATNPMNAMALNDIVRISHPNAKGGRPMIANPFGLFNAIVWLSKTFPFLQYPFGYKETWAEGSRLMEFDNTQSKTVLGIGEYRSMEDTCRDAADSIQPFIVDDNYEPPFL